MSYFSRGNFSSTDALTITGTLTAGALTLLGLLLFSGNIIPQTNNLYDIGSAASSTRSVYASSTVHAGGVTSTGNVNPFANNTYDIGSPALSWRNIYASGTANLAVISADLGVGSAPSYSFKGDSNTGIYGDGAGTVYVTSDGSVKFQIGANNYSYVRILPADNNLRDLGAFGSAWRDIYASGTSYLANIVSTNSTSTYFAVTNVNSALTPLANNIYDIGSSVLSWKNIYASGTLSLGGAATVASLTSSGRVQSVDLLFGSTGNVLLSSESISAASSTVSGAFSFGTVGDRGVLAREFILSGETLGAGAQTLSIIESPTSTLKITNGGTSGFGGLIARSVTSTGGIEIRTLTAAGAGTTNPLCLDSTGVGYIGAAQICPLSSLASKANIRPISYGLDELLKTNFYDFELKQNDGRTHSGVVADYLSKTMPNLVMYEDGKVNGYDVFSMVGVLGQSIKDLNAKVESQQRKIDSLESRLLKLERRK